MITTSCTRTSLLCTRIRLMYFFLPALIFGICRVDVLQGQSVRLPIASPQARITQFLELIRIAEQQHRPDAQRGNLKAQLGMAYQDATEFSKAEDAYNQSLRLLKDAPTSRAEYALTLDSLASLYLYYGRLEDVEKLRKEALAVREKLGDRGEIGVTRVHLADLALRRHQFKKAEQLAVQGKAEMEASATPPRVGMLSAYISLVYARCSLSHCDQGLMDAKNAVAFASENFEPGSPAIGFSLEALGFAQWKAGEAQDGEKTMVQGIDILRARLVAGDPRLAGAMLQYRAYLLAAKRPAEGQQIQNQVTRMSNEAGTYCAGCTIGVSSLSNGLR